MNDNMSSAAAAAYVPFEIQEQIIKSLPVKSLIRFTSVSKQWKSLIESSRFIIDHNLNQTQEPSNLLIKYRHTEDWDDKYMSIVNDQSFPHHNSYLTVPPVMELLCSPFLLDCSSHGLVCVHGNYYERDNTTLILVWNPSIRKSVGIMVPSERLLAVRFGVCPKTNEPKIVRIIEVDHTLDLKTEVFTLSTGTWRTLSPLCLPFEITVFSPNQVVIDGVIYWVAEEMFGRYDDSMIVSFDLTSEEFDQIVLPEDLVLACRGKKKSIAKFQEDSLVLILTCIDPFSCDFWVMKINGGPKSSCSFTKLLEIGSCETIGYLYVFNMLGFNINGDAMLGGHQLRVYEPCSKQMKLLEMNGVDDDHEEGMKMAYYKESLFLLNHSSANSSIIHFSDW